MSGRKKSLHVYNELVIPMFKIANITSELKGIFINFKFYII